MKGYGRGFAINCQGMAIKIPDFAPKAPTRLKTFDEDRARFVRAVVNSISSDHELNIALDRLKSPKDRSAMIDTVIDDRLRGIRKDWKADIRDSEISALFTEIQGAVHDFGPLQELLDDPEITEIMVNGNDEVSF